MDGFANKDRADKIKVDVKCPDGVKFFVFADIELQLDADGKCNAQLALVVCLTWWSGTLQRVRRNESV